MAMHHKLISITRLLDAQVCWVQLTQRTVSHYWNWDAKCRHAGGQTLQMTFSWVLNGVKHIQFTGNVQMCQMPLCIITGLNQAAPSLCSKSG